MMLNADEVKKELIDECKIFHFGSLSLTDEPCRKATYDAVNYAKKLGKIISFDPNYRSLLWSDREKAVNEISRAVGYEHEKHFMKTFKSITGLTPSQYRNNLG